MNLFQNLFQKIIAKSSLTIYLFQETISTCRFAQRVAMVKNQPKINLERDPLQEIEFLKAEINKLKNNLTIINEKVRCN